MTRRGTLWQTVAVVEAESSRRLLRQRVAIALPVRGADERSDDFEVPVGHVNRFAPQVSEAEVDVELEQIDACRLA
jgi:hypothetical protein